MFLRLVCTSLFLAFSASAQDTPPPVRPRETTNARPTTGAEGPKAAKSRKFVLDVVNSAVALPQSDQQDRLRVLSSAVEVMAPIAPKNANELTKEGIRIEAELIALGEKPSVSLFTSGVVDCKTATDFAQRVYPQNVVAAEQSVIGVLTKCPKQAGDVIRMRADAALSQSMVAPRLVMAL